MALGNGDAVDADRAVLFLEEDQVVVTLTRGFWMGIYEVTQAQYQFVMGKNPRKFNGDWAEAEVDRLIKRGTTSDRQEFLRALVSERQRYQSAVASPGTNYDGGPISIGGKMQSDCGLACRALASPQRNPLRFRRRCRRQGRE